jgi:DNA-binding FadR family transcriptional regulator
VSEPLPRIGRAGLLSAQVADALAERILDGGWPDGERIPSEPELSEQFGVSRSVVRDAVQALRTRGLLDVRQGYGTVVRAPSDEPHAAAVFDRLVRSDVTIGDVVAARAAIDASVAVLAATNRTEGDVAALGELARRMVEAERRSDWPALEEAHVRFHVTLVEACHLPALAIMLRPLQAIVLATGAPALADSRAWGAETHLPIVDAVAMGDAAFARQAMTRHYDFRRDPAYAELHAMAFRESQAARSRVRTE